MNGSRPAAFLDRDGVINVDKGFVASTEDFVLVEGAARAIALLNRCGYLVFVVTNQSGIGRGYFSLDRFKELMHRMDDMLGEEGAHIDDVRYCPFHPEAELAEYRSIHPWRKPAPGMILDLMKHWPVDEGSSFLIGDSARDLAAAKAAGISGFLFEGGDLYDFLISIRPELAGPL